MPYNLRSTGLDFGQHSQASPRRRTQQAAQKSGTPLLRRFSISLGKELRGIKSVRLLAKHSDGIYAVTMLPIVIDTNVFVAGLRSGDGASREILRRALSGIFQPLFGNALWLEYQDLLGRPVWGEATMPTERTRVLAALAKQGRWVTVYYGWRPNLPTKRTTT